LLLNALVAEIFSLIALLAVGIIIKKKGHVSAEMERGLGNFMLYISIPAMLIVSLNNLDVGTDLDFWLRLPALVGGAYVFIIVFSLASVRFLRYSAHRRNTLTIMMIFSNVGNIAIPVLGAMFGSEGILYSAMFMLFFSALLWTIGLVILRGSAAGLTFRMFLSPPLVAVFVGLALFFSPFQLPHFVALPLAQLGSTVVLLGMLIVGFALATLKPADILGNKPLWGIVLFRQLAMPPIFFILASLIVSDWRAVAITTMMVAMPSGVSAAAFVINYNGDGALAAQAVVATTFVALPVFPVLFWFMTLFA